MALIKCKECGKEYSSNAKACPKCGNPTEEKEETIDVNIKNEPTVNININEKPKRKWSTGKLIIAIISMVLFIIVAFQSCAAGLGNALADNGSDSGSSGFLCALFLLIGGIITMATRNSKGNGGCITAIVFYWLGALFTIGTGDTYPDLPIWGSIAFAFGLINLGSLIVEKPKFNELKKQKIILIALIIISIIVFIISISSGSTDDKKNNSNNNNTNSSTNANTNDNTNSNINTESNKKNTYGLNETFTFDELEITLGSEVTYTKVNNKYSDNHGKSVVKIPVTIKNLKDETHSLNMFYYKAFGSKGTQLDTLGYYFDNSVDEAGDLRSGASYTKYFYLLYDGDGTYAIEFDNWAKKITVEFEIKK